MQTPLPAQREVVDAGAQASGSTSTLPGGLNLPWLDALRGWAIVLVVLVHASFLTAEFRLPAPSFFAWAEFGQRGVQLFYLISAFTLMLSLDHARPQHGPLRNFYLRRFFRIAPLYYVAVLINMIFFRMTHGFQLSRTNVALGLVFLNGLRPSAINSVALGGWSVAVEMMFYVILPFLAGKIGTAWRAFLTGALTAAIVYPLSSHLASLRPNPEWQKYFSTFWFPVELPVFLLGMATYAFWKNYFTPWLAGKLPGQRRLISITLLALVPLVLLLPFVPQLYSASLAFCPLMLGLSAWPWAPLQNRVTVLLGRVSYSVYLLHFFVVEAFARILFRLHWHGRLAATSLATPYPRLSVLLATGIILALTLPIAKLSARLIEQPGMALGRRVIAALEAREEQRRGPEATAQGASGLSKLHTSA